MANRRVTRNKSHPEHHQSIKTAVKREPTSLEVEWGPTCITGGPERGRIGYYDDDNSQAAIVYFGDALLADRYSLIPYRFIKYATLDDLLKRREKIHIQITPLNHESRLSLKKKNNLLLELLYIETTIGERMLFARYGEPTQNGRKLFISHSSKDKWFVHKIADDLKTLGHDVWLDETRIKVGDSIPKAIQKGIDDAEFVIIFLSPNSVFSRWVEVEWVSKFLAEIESGAIKVLPALIEACEIPTLLKAKKYADFTENYDNALREIIEALS